MRQSEDIRAGELNLPSADGGIGLAQLKQCCRGDPVGVVKGESGHFPAELSTRLKSKVPSWQIPKLYHLQTVGTCERASYADPKLQEPQ